MNNARPPAHVATEAQEIARQADVELAILLGIEESFRIALQWLTRGRKNSRKLSTMRFHAWSFGRSLTRIQVLADHGGYMHLITDANPHLAGEVEALRNERNKLQSSLERMVARLDHVSGDDALGFGKIGAELERFLDDLRTHGRNERELLLHSVPSTWVDPDENKVSMSV